MFNPPHFLGPNVCPTVGTYWLLATWGVGVPPSQGAALPPGTAVPLGPLGSSSSLHRQTPKIVLYKDHASFRIVGPEVYPVREGFVRLHCQPVIFAKVKSPQELSTSESIFARLATLCLIGQFQWGVDLGKKSWLPVD